VRLVYGDDVIFQCADDALMCADSLWNISWSFYGQPAAGPLHITEAIHWYDASFTVFTAGLLHWPIGLASGFYNSL